MENSPERKGLKTVSFMVHSTRGIIRDQNTRRKTMFLLLVVALVLLCSGSTFLAPTLDPREHPGWFILFWFLCIWLTCTALLLAFFDILLIRAQARKVEKILRAGLAKSSESPTPGDDD